MTDLDQRIRSDLDRAVSTAPPPVPIETILSRTESGVEPGSQPHRRWAVALPTLAAVAMALVAFLIATDEPGPGPIDIEATETPPEPDNTQRPPSSAAVEVEITVQGGLWLSETIPQIADQLPGITANQLWAALEDNDPSPLFTPTDADLTGLDVPGLSGPQLRWEGLLAPGTYSIDPDSNPADVIEELHDEFLAAARDLGYDQAPDTLGLSPYEIVVIASLVETADPVNENDRAKIATVIHNRLAEDMPIGLDSAYPYATQDRDLTLIPAVLEAPGPYGLRTTPGLPPTPIATPSRASLRAAIEPTPGPWLFYVIGDDQGNYSFATTLAEHSANVAAAHENGLLD